jgi:basic membrane protein A and related proteins
MWKLFSVGTVLALLASSNIISAEAEQTKKNATKAAAKIALLCTGSVTDGGWNQLAKEACDVVKRETGATITVVQKVTQDVCGDELRAFAADGYDLAIAHGYEFLQPATEVASSGVQMKIAVSGADVVRPGIVTIDFDVSQASYQLGIIAARISKTGKLGFVGGAPIPSVKACFRGFVAGAKSIRSDISVAEAYTSWDEPVKSKQQTEAFFTQDIDMVFHVVDAASRGVFEAVLERNKRRPEQPVYVFGSVANQNANPICSPFTLGSAVIRLDKTFLQLARAVQEKTFTPGLIHENLARETCVTILNPLLLNTVLSAELQAEIAQAGQALASGAIRIPVE